MQKWVKINTSPLGIYIAKESSDFDIEMLGFFLTSEVGCYENSFQEWAGRKDYTGYGGNITLLDKDDNYIYLAYDPFIFEEEKKFKIPRQAFIDLLEEWKKLCMVQPEQILITYDGEKFTITSSNEIPKSSASSSLEKS